MHKSSISFHRSHHAVRQQARVALPPRDGGVRCMSLAWPCGFLGLSFVITALLAFEWKICLERHQQMCTKPTPAHPWHPPTGEGRAARLGARAARPTPHRMVGAPRRGNYQFFHFQTPKCPFHTKELHPQTTPNGPNTPNTRPWSVATGTE